MTLKYSYAEVNIWKLPVDRDVMLVLGTFQHLLVTFWLDVFGFYPDSFPFNSEILKKNQNLVVSGS